MPSETVVALTFLAGSGALVAAVQFLPPLTAHEAPLGRRDAGGQLVMNEQAYCRAELSGVDCDCFARKAVQVMAQDRPPVAGWSYADKWQLALAQGTDACR